MLQTKTYTALRILNSDLKKATKQVSTPNASNQKNVNHWHTARNKKVKATKTTNRPGCGVLLNNAYTVLHIEDDEETSADNIKLPTKAQTTDRVISQRQTTSEDKHKNRRKNVEVMKESQKKKDVVFISECIW